MSTNTFSVPDYVVFAAMLAVSAGIGVYYACAGGRQRSTREFLMADNSMRYLPLSLSVLASFFSASTLLGTPAEIYQFGAMYWISVVGACMAPITGALLFGPMFFKIKVISVFEYLELRFKSKVVRLFGAFIFLLRTSVGMGIVLFGPSTALSAVTGLSEWVIVVLVGMVCTFYTTLGGLKAVVWTDVFQTLVMLTGMLTVLIKASIELGGMDEVWRVCQRGGRLHFFDFDPDPRIRHTFWGLTLGIFLIWLPPYTVDQQMVQRFSSARSLREAKIALLLNAPGMFIIITLCSLTGLVLYAQYADCDPLRDGKVQNPNQLSDCPPASQPHDITSPPLADNKVKVTLNIDGSSSSEVVIVQFDSLLPYFVVGVLGHLQGMSGLFVASLFSGALSSVSSMMNSLAAVTWEDFLKIKLGHLSDETAAKVTKFLVLLYGGLGVGLAFLVKELGGTVLQASLTLNGAAGAPLVGLFILGAAFTTTNWIGALAGGILGLTFSIWLSVGAYVSKPLNFRLPTSLAGCNATGNSTYVLTTHLAVTSTVVMTQAEVTYSPSDPRQLEGLNNLYGLSYLWFSGLGIATTVICGLVVSWLTGFTKFSDASMMVCAGATKSDDVKEDYQLQVFRRVTSCRSCYLAEDYNVTSDVNLKNLTEEENCKAEGRQQPSGDVEPNNRCRSTFTSPRRTTSD